MSGKQLAVVRKRPQHQSNKKVMGKKRVIETTEKELIAETDKVAKKMKQDVSFKRQATLQKGNVYISSTYNNTIISLTNENGDVVANRSAGAIGFKGTKKGTSFAGSKVAEAIIAVCDKFAIRDIDVFIKGIGGGRNAALKTLAGKGMKIQSIKDETPVPHNGCRPKKPRRV